MRPDRKSDAVIEINNLRNHYLYILLNFSKPSGLRSVFLISGVSGLGLRMESDLKSDVIFEISDTSISVVHWIFQIEVDCTHFCKLDALIGPDRKSDTMFEISSRKNLCWCFVRYFSVWNSEVGGMSESFLVEEEIVLVKFLIQPKTLDSSFVEFQSDFAVFRHSNGRILWNTLHRNGCTPKVF